MIVISFMVIRSISSTCFSVFHPIMLLSHLNSRWIPEILVIPLCSQISITLKSLTETSQFSCLSPLAGCCTNKENDLPETQLPTLCQISLHSLGSSSSSPSVSQSLRVWLQILYSLIKLNLAISNILRTLWQNLQTCSSSSTPSYLFLRTNLV